MAKIVQLSKHLINQIAAGEVIERPASVVKELIENSIDAGSTKISVTVENDCRNLRIADNGSGIHPDDIVLAFSKHATSKIKDEKDLYSISTLGFRGEALSSIISIAKVTCTTRTEEFEYGTRVECENSEIKKSKTGCAVGTIMQVENLFYNIPARLKFLKSSKTEFSYIQELVQSLALINPHVAFELSYNGKKVLKTSGCGDSLNTVKEVFSSEVSQKLKEVFKSDKLSNLKISGFVSTPDLTRSSKKNYHIYINSRTVKCPVFQKAIDLAYKNTLSSGKYPFVVLNLELLPEDVDVNVHPAKKEVRYKNTNQIFNFIYSAIDMALSNNAFDLAQTRQPVQNTPSVYDFKPKSKQGYDEEAKISEVIIDQQNFLPEFGYSGNISAISNNSETDGNSYAQTNIASQSNDLYSPLNSQNEENIIGQYKNTYILIEKEDGLEIVDQHIAEERFIYEKLKKQKQAASQMLFISDILEISASEAELLKENKEKLEHFGYGIEIIKENQVIFRKVPQLLSKISPKELLSDILENISGTLDNKEEKILIMTSCKAAIKAGQKLNMYQMQEIIKNWRTCEKPYTCPHGRPISKVLKHKDIAKFFERNE